MSIGEHIVTEEISTIHKFFEDVKNSNTKEIRKYFQNESIKPWELIEEDGYSGNINLTHQHYTRHHLWIYSNQ